MKKKLSLFIIVMFSLCIITSLETHKPILDLQTNKVVLSSTSHKVILDTDFAMPPQDDALATILALNSPQINLIGITTVAGNNSVEQATADLLRMLEIANREDIPVFVGANMPLVHEKTEYAQSVWGKWWSDEAPSKPPGGFAKKKAEKESAVDFIVKSVRENPGEITIIAIGPLTNIAKAIRQEPGFAQNVKQLVIMGGAIARLPDGAGNVTPNAEFNFWVDPEAAKVVLRSGIPITLSPLNVSRKTHLTKNWYEKLVTVDTPITRLIKETMGPQYAKNPDHVYLMYDQVAVASLINPTIVKTKDLYVDVDINHGMNYGTSVGWNRIWPGAEGAQKVLVQYDLDWEKFINLFIKEVIKPVPQK
ncbi:nucleoside hydrolase [Clostridium ganghwense]|uniref:Nucleoside hydrolase n=1 Tax=Clostridium ganghwense TaxID=312089 RepID=A0ABT4CJM5_9CLOT|nr:nucleoside hydrolase [Clostridium ganghwense]MCY6369249.1 nucleoside hydrolase [Clostridium ganghwense]